jgi:DNA-binding transcriptional LysR family regulator
MVWNMDRFESMEVFISVVELGSFTATANAFRMSPSMVTKHINALEKRLGSTLLTRTTRRLHLTEIGRNYFESCKEILRQVSAAEAGAEILRGAPKGLLKVSAPIWFGTFPLTSIISDYLIEYTEVSVELSLSDRFVDIIDEGFDVAIRIGDLNDSSYVARKLTHFELAVCASPKYLKEQGIPKNPDELKNHECLSFTNWKSEGGWKVLSKNLTSKMNGRSRFDSNNGQALREAALKGLGLILMPKVLLENNLKDGSLVEVLHEFHPPARPVNAVYPRERQTTPRVASFVDYLIKRLR